jgi:hypothetical protein
MHVGKTVRQAGLLRAADELFSPHALPNRPPAVLPAGRMLPAGNIALLVTLDSFPFAEEKRLFAAAASYPSLRKRQGRGLRGKRIFGGREYRSGF